MQIIVLTREYFSQGEGLHYICAPALDLVEAGRDADQARFVFMQALKILVDGWLEKGNMYSRLQELGYIEDVRTFEAADGDVLTTFCPPPLSSRLDEEDLTDLPAASEITYNALTYNFQGPLINAS